jgi:hypothetical protein
LKKVSPRFHRRDKSGKRFLAFGTFPADFSKDWKTETLMDAKWKSLA